MSDQEKQYTHLEVEAALCVWEEINERTLKRQIKKYPALAKCRSDWGSVSLRHASIGIGRFCLKVYDLIPENLRDGRAYDWEIIPAIMDHVDFSQPGEPEQFKFPEPQEVANVLISAWSFEDWLRDANAALEQGWGIDFIKGAGVERAEMERIFRENPGRSGQEMAQWWADKYDLDRIDGPWASI